MKQTQKDYPELNERAIGWLNFLYEKATTSDDWTEDGEPNEWWDKTSTPPNHLVKRSGAVSKLFLSPALSSSCGCC